jgi:hypothetical protein
MLSTGSGGSGSVAERGPTLSCEGKTNGNTSGSRMVRGTLWLTAENGGSNGAGIPTFIVNCRLQHRIESLRKATFGWRYEDSTIHFQDQGTITGITAPINGGPSWVTITSPAAGYSDETFSRHYGSTTFTGNCACWANNIFNFAPGTVSGTYFTSVATCDLGN